MTHIGEKGLRTLKNKNHIKGMNDFTLEFDLCKYYVYKKYIFFQFYSSSHKYYWALDLVHLDVFGHFNVPSISMSLYYVFFIDDFSRRTLVYFLKSKF